MGGAALMDVWSLVLRRRFGIPTLDYALLGPWIDRIAAAEPVPGERPLGWLAHYSVGITFALLHLAIWGPEWVQSPRVLPAMLIGLGTIVAPWFLMQTAMGAGIAGSKTPNPRAARLRNLGTHAVYGVGFYVSALALSIVGRGWLV